MGNPRSGTTLLRLILTSNSKITIPPECSFIIWLFDKYSNWKPSDSSNFLKVASF
ncbi:sulfotransferase [Candidatus Thioglobus sp.]|nr:sulfotransferase [Candidatus Thioglobus sp.]